MAEANNAMPFRGIKLNRMPDINAGAVATRTVNSLPLRRADFACLADALDYAALGDTGANFYSGKGRLSAVLPYRNLREKALECFETAGRGTHADDGRWPAEPSVVAPVRHRWLQVVRITAIASVSLAQKRASGGLESFIIPATMSGT